MKTLPAVFASRLLVHAAGSPLKTFRLLELFFSAGLPRAGQALRHFRCGKGTPLAVSLLDLLDEDNGFKNHLFYHLSQQIASGSNRGTAAIPQTAFRNLDWRMTLGHIEIDWMLNGNTIETGFTKTYKWSPDDQRPTQSIHRAAQELKATGAADFPIIGKPAAIPVSDVLDGAWEPSLVAPLFFM